MELFNRAKNTLYKDLIPVYFTLLFFLIIYCLISLVNHYNFRTYGWDLGLFNNALFDYAHFRWNEETLVQPIFHISNSLADHFTFYPIILSPLYWIFGSFTFLIFQILAILFGGYGIYKLIFYFSSSSKLALLAMIHFFLTWGIYAALSFDYHDNVVASMLVPWFIYYFYKNENGKAFIFFLLVLFAKENLALWMLFICIGLIMLNYKERKKVIVAIKFSLYAILYFALIVFVIIPLINKQEGYIHFRYSALGENFHEAILKLLSSPQQVFSLLFESPVFDDNLTGMKSELHYFVLLSGGFALLLRPQFLIMLIPIYAQKMFSDDIIKWGVHAHYSIEFSPILTIALFYFINDFKLKVKPIFIGWLSILLCTLITIKYFNTSNSPFFNSINSMFYNQKHYQKTYDVNKVKATLDKIPKNASVSAQSILIPRLAMRDRIYHLPFVDSSDYAAFIKTDENLYPYNVNTLKIELNKFNNSILWEKCQEDSDIVIFHKKDLSKLKPEKEFVIDFDDEKNEYYYATTDSIHYNGSRSFFMKSSYEYSPTIVIKNNSKDTMPRYIYAEIALMPIQRLDSRTLYFVISIEEEDKSILYYAKDTREWNPQRNKWSKIAIDIKYSQPLLNKTIKVYLYNKGKNNFYIDCFKTIIY